MAKIFRKPRASTVIFYTLVLLAIGGFFYIMSGALSTLNTYLQEYQASHINTRYQEEFQALFADRDWGKLYDLAGIEDTEYESRQAFIDYMQAKVGSEQLTCFIESNGTSGKKCPVYAGNTEIGVFYMESAPEPPMPDPWYYQIPFVETVVGSLKMQSWERTGLTLHYARNEGVSICTDGDRIVYVNGIALTNEYLTSTMVTKAESYLPQGLHGARRQTFYVDGFLVAPEVTATDLQGNPIQLVETAPGQYSEVFPQMEIPEYLKERLIQAGQTYCRYMIGIGGPTKLREYFHKGTNTYKSITGTDLWTMQDYIDYRFSEPLVSEYYAYSEELVSVRLEMSLFVMRPDRSEKEYAVNATFFMSKDENGVFKVQEMTNVDIQATFTQVRLRFYLDGDLVASQMVDSAAKQLQLPQVGIPQGKSFDGWFQYITNEDGNQTLTLVFAAQEGTATVYLAQGTQLQPMDLHARFSQLYAGNE